MRNREKREGVSLSDESDQLRHDREKNGILTHNPLRKKVKRGGCLRAVRVRGRREERSIAIRSRARGE